MRFRSFCRRPVEAQRPWTSLLHISAPREGGPPLPGRPCTIQDSAPRRPALWVVGGIDSTPAGRAGGYDYSDARPWRQKLTDIRIPAPPSVLHQLAAATDEGAGWSAVTPDDHLEGLQTLADPFYST